MGSGDDSSEHMNLDGCQRKTQDGQGKELKVRETDQETLGAICAKGDELS